MPKYDSGHVISAQLQEWLAHWNQFSMDFKTNFPIVLLEIRNRRLQLEAVQHLIQLLPVPNRDTLAAILQFFARVVDNASDTRSKTGMSYESYFKSTLSSTYSTGLFYAIGLYVRLSVRPSVFTITQEWVDSGRRMMKLCTYLCTSGFRVTSSWKMTRVHDLWHGQIWEFSYCTFT